MNFPFTALKYSSTTMEPHDVEIDPHFLLQKHM